MFDNNVIKMDSLEMYFPQKTSNIQFNDLVLFNVEVNDTYNTQVLGQTKDYCWGEVCILPPVKGLYSFLYNYI